MATGPTSKILPPISDNNYKKDDNNIKKEIDAYKEIISNISKENTNAANIQSDKAEKEREKDNRSKNKSVVALSKVPGGENVSGESQKYIIRQVVDKIPYDSRSEKNLFVLTEEDIDNTEENYKRNLEELKKLLIFNKSILNTEVFSNTVNDIISQIYISLSPDTRNLMFDNQNFKQDITYFLLHMVNGNIEKIKKDKIITADMINNICCNLLQISDINPKISKPTTDKKKNSKSQGSKMVFEEVALKSNTLVFEDDKLEEHLKLRSKRHVISQENEIEFVNKEKQETLLDETCLNIFQEFAKVNKDEVITKKIENILDTLYIKKFNGKNSIDEKLKQELIKEFKHEYINHIQKNSLIEKKKGVANPFTDHLDNKDKDIGGKKIGAFFMDLIARGEERSKR